MSKNLKKAFITGINGQDGANLSEYLLKNDYKVCGIIRRSSVSENQTSRINHILNDIELEYGDLLDASSLERTIKLFKPDEIYNLAAMSHVKVSFDMPQFTVQTNMLGLLNMLEAYKNNVPDAKFYQASSSEQMGNSVDNDGFQRETTPMHPVSPYGCSKLACYHLVKIYRNSYGLFASNGILFNHSGTGRGSNFVESKIIKKACEIKKKLDTQLFLGNLDTHRDLGASKDYVKAMHMILNHKEPDDFVIATGETQSIRNICSYVFSKLNMDYLNYVKIDPKFFRPNELQYLKGDSTKAKTILGWSPTYTFEMLMDEMINYWIDRV